MNDCKMGVGTQSRDSREGRLIFANTINELTYREMSPDSMSLVDLLAFQELWLIQPGDVFVTARPLPRDFVKMVCDFRGLEATAFTCLSPDVSPEEPLLAAIRRVGMLSELRKVANANPRMQIRACALDQPLLDISNELGLLIEGYTSPPSASLVKRVEHLNTKSGFREVCELLGLQIAPGFSYISADEVEAAVLCILSEHRDAVVKCDRGSGGSGQFRIGHSSLKHGSRSLRELDQFVRKPSHRGNTFVVETFLPLQLDPTVDVEISEDGPRRLHVGAMDCADGAFSGMSVPAQGFAGKPLADLHVAADRLGACLFESGYRGFFDIDAGLTNDGNLCLFEANVRRTSTSLWDGVLQNIISGSNGGELHWSLSMKTLPADFNSTDLPVTMRTVPSTDGMYHEQTVQLAAWASSPQNASVLFLEAWRSHGTLAPVDSSLGNAVLMLV